MANNDIRVLGDLELTGALVFGKNFNDFPVDPKPRTIVVKAGQAFMYTELVNGSGYFTWQPIGTKYASFLHTQGVASTSWTVSHGFNTTDFAYFVYDNNHRLVIANIEIVDSNTARIVLSEAMTGTAVFFSTQFVTAPAITASESVTIQTIALRDAQGVLTVNNNPVAMAEAVATAVAQVESSISAEVVRATAAEAALGQRIDNVVSNLDPVALDSLTEVVQAFQNADGSLVDSLSSLGTSTTSAIANEAARAQAAEASLRSDLTAEVTARQTAVTTAFTAAEDYVDAQIQATLGILADNVATAGGDANAYTDAAVADEIAARIAGDAATLTSANSYADGKLLDEATARAQGDASTLASAKVYTDLEVYNQSVVRVAAEAQVLVDAKVYADGKDAIEAAARAAGDVATQSAAKTYTDAQIASEVTARDTAVATAKAQAQSYADTAVAAEATARTAADAAGLQSAKDYTDTTVATEAAARAAADAATLTSANSFATSADTVVLNSAKSYADGKIRPEVKSYMTAFDGDIIPSQTLTYNLGSPTHQFHSVYVGPGTLYVNGKPVIQDNSDTITFSTDPDQNLMIKTTGNGHLQLAAAAGTIDVQATMAIQSGKRITDSAGVQVEFGNAIQMNSNKIVGLANPTVGTDAATKAYVDGLTSTDSTIVRTSGAQTIAGVKTFSDGVIVNGDFTVNGTTTTINAVTLKIADNLIDLNSDFTAGTPTENAGIRVMRGDLAATQIRWNETADQWELTSDGATFVKVTTATDLANKTTALTGDVIGTGTSSISTYLSSTGVTAGTYGAAGSVATFTVDAKGRLTAAGNAAISIASSQVSDFSSAARGTLSFAAGSGGYNSTTGVITIPTNTNQLTNGAGFITGYTETSTLDNVVARGSSTTRAMSTGALTVSGAVSATGAISGNTVTVTNGVSSGSLSTGVITYSMAGDAAGSPINHFVVTSTTNDVLRKYTPTNVAATIQSVASGSWGISITGNAATATSATKLATARSIALSGDATGSATFDGSAGVTIAATLANSGVTAGIYGNAASIPAVTVDAKGRVTGITTNTVSVTSASVTDFAEAAMDAVAGSITSATHSGITVNYDDAANRLAYSLTSTGVTSGTYGTSTSVGTFTVDGQGRVTSATNTAIVFPVTTVAGKTGAVTLSTADVSEDTTNKYFTTARARSSISASGSVSYDSITGVISFTDAVTSVFGRTGAVTLQSSDVTSALGFTPENSANKGVANGYASLGSDGKVPSSQLPSYVDDVVEAASFANLPATGESGKIYVALDTGKTYRWGGSAYVEISAAPGSTDAVVEGSTNLYFTNARARAAISVTSAAASGSGSLAYNSSTGVLTFTPPSLSSYLTAESDTLATVTARGASTNTAVTFSGGLTASSITVDGFGGIDTANLTTSATTAGQVLDSNSATAFRTVKYLIQATSGTAYQSVELLLIHDGTSVSMVEYANVATGADLADFDADVSGGQVRLLATPVNAATTFKVMKTLVGV